MVVLRPSQEDLLHSWDSFHRECGPEIRDDPKPLIFRDFFRCIGYGIVREYARLSARFCHMQNHREALCYSG